MDPYARQRLLPEVGEAGQERLARARVLVVGAGGLGCPALTYLAAAGVGTAGAGALGILDPDRVDAANLHRQVLYGPADVGIAKVEAARRALARQWPGVRTEPRAVQLEAGNADGLVRGWDVVLSCTDDGAARDALNRACVEAGAPYVHAAVSRWEGELLTVMPGSPCLRCAHPAESDAPTCAEEGVLGPVPGVLGTLQAAEALKVLLGLPPWPGLLLLDLRGGETRTISLKRRQGCVCQPMPAACPLPWNAPRVPDIPVGEYMARKEEFFLLDVREPEEFEEARMPGSVLIPMGELPQRIAEVPRTRPVVVYCAVGGRSARATEMLRRQGYEAVNLRGGIQAWLAHQ